MVNILAGVSKIGLGTVEIGLPYGLGVRNLPSEEEAENILRAVVDLGITYIDTARGYGLAEERIGKFGLENLPGVLVGTKCAQFLERGEDPRGAELARRIREEIDTSRRLLQIDCLPLAQLHGGSQEQIERGELIEIMQKLKDEGKVGQVGISIRGSAAALAAIQSKFFQTIQMAYSILDQRMERWPVLAQAREFKVGIINRSVLLQGVLTAAREKLPAALAPLKANAEAAAAIASQAGMDLPTLAIRFAASNPAISTILIGTIHPEHLKTALAAVAAGPLPEDMLTELRTLAIDDPAQVDPARWPAIA